MDMLIEVIVGGEYLYAYKRPDIYMVPEIEHVNGSIYFNDAVFSGEIIDNKDKIAFHIFENKEDDAFMRSSDELVKLHFKKIDESMFINVSSLLINRIKKILKMRHILGVLLQKYPAAVCSLDFIDPLELMVSVQLSAQCTDKRVNTVTKGLFRRFRNVDDYADADKIELEGYIRPTGFYRNKAKNIINFAKKLRDTYNYSFPDTLEELMKLDGVGRKTGNLFLSEVYKIPGIVVDTHVKRISKRLELSDSDDPEKIEYDLNGISEKKDWRDLGHLFINFGREICKARRPECGKCSFTEICAYYNNIK